MNLDLKITVSYFHGDVASSRAEVTVKSLSSNGELLRVPSPSDFVGVGGCFGSAKDDYIRQIDEYIESLESFRKQVLDTPRVYTEAITVDSSGSAGKENNGYD